MSKLTVVEGRFGPRAPADLPEVLRTLANLAESGEITSLICSCVSNGDYELHFSASPAEGLILSSLLHARAVERMKA